MLHQHYIRIISIGFNSYKYGINNNYSDYSEFKPFVGSYAFLKYLVFYSFIIYPVFVLEN